MWQSFIEWCETHILPHILIKFNLIYIYMDLKILTYSAKFPWSFLCRPDAHYIRELAFLRSP